MKILMLHGYSQNSVTFRTKLRRLEERLHQTFPNTELVWPEGPLQLNPSDVPGCEYASSERQKLEGPELRAWFHLRYVQDPPHGLFQSLDMLAEVLERDGPFDGVIAFSQGTILAAILASLLQGETRLEAFQRTVQTSPEIMPYPEAFMKLQHPPLKFGIMYAGRVGTTSYSDWLYENPPIDTPFCHFVGRWDPMVDHEERDAVLTKLSSSPDSRTIVHAGGHFVPVDDMNTDHVLDFLAQCSNRTSSSGGGSTGDGAYGAVKGYQRHEIVIPRKSNEAEGGKRWHRGVNLSRPARRRHS